MTNPEFERWQNRYAAAAGHLFGEEPNHFLAGCADLLPQTAQVLAVADGDGRNGVWLARQGLTVTSLDFSPVAQGKAKALAARYGVDVKFEQGDVHTWAYPVQGFDIVAEIFAQFSMPDDRARKWAVMRDALRPGGLMIIQGYTPRQLTYATGGPKLLEQLYTEDLLRAAFGDYALVRLAIEERELHEGDGHSGMSATIGMVWRKPAAT